MNPKVHIIKDLISTMSDAEIQELCKVCGFELIAPQALGITKEVDTTYRVRLVNVHNDGKLRTCKKIKELLLCDLKTAKDLMDSAPCIIKTDMSMEDALEMASELSKCGCETRVLDRHALIISKFDNEPDLLNIT